MEDFHDGRGCGALRRTSRGSRLLVPRRIAIGAWLLLTGGACRAGSPAVAAAVDAGNAAFPIGFADIIECVKAAVFGTIGDLKKSRLSRRALPRNRPD